MFEYRSISQRGGIEMILGRFLLLALRRHFCKLMFILTKGGFFFLVLTDFVFCLVDVAFCCVFEDVDWCGYSLIVWVKDVWCSQFWAVF